MENSKNTQKVTISFYDPFSVYPKLSKSLESRLPLTNLHWKASEKAPLRTIPGLDVELVEEIPKSSNKPAAVSKAINESISRRNSLLKRMSSLGVAGKLVIPESETISESSIASPVSEFSVESPIVKQPQPENLDDIIGAIKDSYLKIMFFEAQNIDHYKQNVRPFIKEWFKQSVDNSRLPTDWLLVFYVPEGGKDDNTTAFKYGLVDKIKLDFNAYKNASFTSTTSSSLGTSSSSQSNGVNSGNGLKIFKIKHDYSNVQESTQAWNVLMSGLKTGILNTFTERVKFFESKISHFLEHFENESDAGSKGSSAVKLNDDEIEKPVLDDNIGLYFMMNENLAILYHDLSLYEDSLIQYDNLEQIFEFYLGKHSQDTNIAFLRKIGFENKLESNNFYFNIYEEILKDDEQDYAKIAPKVFERLTNFSHQLFEVLRRKILNNEISYFEMRNYFFLKQITLINSVIFDNYSQLSSTPSYNAVHIFDLLQRLKSFIVTLTFEILQFTQKSEEQIDVLKLFEYSFTMIENYLLFINEYFFKPPHKVSEDSDLPPLGNKAFAIYSKNKEINNIVGELRLLQRFLVVILGHSFDYKIESIHVDRSIELKLKGLESFAKKSGDFNVIFDHPMLKDRMSSFAKFSTFYKHLTESAIGNFNVADKPRSVDILSIDIALLNYQLGNYEQSLQVLLNCPNFYNEQGWEFIGFYLLKVFINCLEKVILSETDEAQITEHRLLLFKSYLDYLATLLDSSTKMIDIPLYSNSNFVNNTLANINEYLTNTEEIDTILSQVLKLKNSIKLEYDLNRIFEYKIVPFVVCDELNVYSVEIELSNLILFFNKTEGSEEKFVCDSVELVLQNINNKEEKVVFSCENFELSRNKNKLVVSSRHVLTGRFIVESLSLKIGGITLFREHIKETENEDGEIESEYEIKEILLIHPYITNVHFEIRNPLLLNLNHKQLLVKVNVPKCNIKDVKLRVKGTIEMGAELDLVIKKRTTLENGSYDYDDDSLFDADSISESKVKAVDNDLFEIGNFDENSLVDVIIPYNLPAEDPKPAITLCTKLEYKCGEADYSLTSYQELNTTLSVAVSVQDIFKGPVLFSKFSVGAAEPRSPIRLLATHLDSNESYETSTALEPPPTIAFGEQPVTYFFKIQPRSESYISGKDDSLKLVVKYRNLSEEIFEIVWKYFKTTYLTNEANNTNKDHINKYVLLLKDYLFKLLVFDLNEYALLHSLRIKHFNIFDFTELFTHFFPEDRSKYLSIFNNFISKLKNNDLGLDLKQFDYINDTSRYDNEAIAKQERANDVYFSNINRELFIDVPIPLVQVVHNVNLEFEPKSQFIVGEPISAKLHIESYVNWRGVENSSKSKSDSEPKKKRVLFEDPNKDSSVEKFMADFVGPSESWLVAGKRKFQFAIDKEGKNGSPIMTQDPVEVFIVPLKIGKLLLPKIEVKSVNNHLNDEFSMEVDYKNSSQTVLVVPNLERVTFAF